MKTVFLVSAVILLSWSHGKGQITLHAGSSYSHQFSTLAFEGNSTFGIAEPSGALFLYVEPGFPFELGPTNSYKVEMFEDLQTQAPILSRTITRNSSPQDINYRVPDAWGDLQGRIRITALSGSVTLRGFSFQAIRTGNPAGFDVYGTDRIFLPAPPVVSILSTGSTITVSWPASATNFMLEATTKFGSPGTWEPVTNAVAWSGSTFSTTVDPGETSRFFRLRWNGQ